MRQLKFRAWDQHSKKFFTAEEPDEYGEGGTDLYISNDGHPTIFSQDDGGKNGLWEHIVGTGKHLILMQYTNLNDKDGKEIYEGDIVLLTNQKEWKEKGDSEHMEGVGVVKFVFPEYCAVKNIDTDNEAHMLLNWGGTESIEIIGNIYQNPELLK